MEDNQQCKRWLLTFDNIDVHGITHENIRECLSQFTLKYFCMEDEKTDKGMLHTHLYLETENNCRFKTVKSRFPSIAHIDKALGTPQQCRDYVRKEGKYKDSEKSTTSIPETFEEEGEITVFGRGQNRYEKIVSLIEQGLTNFEIIKIDPSYAFKIKDMDVIRYSIMVEKYARENRDLDVTYIYGAPGTGKTRMIFEKHDGTDICRITNYKKDGTVNFDSYNMQPVLVFEEFHGQVEIESMLNYLDIYPINLPARYSDKVACFKTVYITSNLSLEEQYERIQKEKPFQWKAFLRRIHKVLEFREDGSVIDHGSPSWRDEWDGCQGQIDC